MGTRRSAWVHGSKWPRTVSVMLSMVLRTMPTEIRLCTAVLGSPGASTQLPSFVELKLSRQNFIGAFTSRTRTWLGGSS